MMVKLWRLMGFLVEKEEEEDGGDGGVVVGMVEKMEERKVEELVVKVVEMEGRVAGQGGRHGGFGAAVSFAGNGEGREK